MSLAINLTICLLVLGTLFIDESQSQITFSRSWVPQGKRSTPHLNTRALPGATSTQGDLEGLRETIGEAGREARITALVQVASNVADLIEETTNDSLLALRLRNALSSRNTRAV